jgi:hypothetical protein
MQPRLKIVMIYTNMSSEKTSSSVCESFLDQDGSWEGVVGIGQQAIVGAVVKQKEVGEAAEDKWGCVLVRPDGHIAWCSPPSVSRSSVVDVQAATKEVEDKLDVLMGTVSNHT